jgi:hypothetical protein
MDLATLKLELSDLLSERVRVSIRIDLVESAITAHKYQIRYPVGSIQEVWGARYRITGYGIYGPVGVQLRKDGSDYAFGPKEIRGLR